jgi:GAF domain-containing protein
MLVLQTGRPARLDDYASATGEAGTFVRLSGIRAAVGAPVSVEGRLWGLVAVASTRGPLPAGTEEPLAAFTELAATAIANAQAREELRSFAAGQAALRRVAVLVSQGASPEEVFAAVAQEVDQVLGTEYAWVTRYDPEGTETVVGAWAATGDAVPIPVSSRLALGGGMWRRWCSRRAGPHGSTTTRTIQARSGRCPTRSAFGLGSAHRSVSRGACGAS